MELFLADPAQFYGTTQDYSSIQSGLVVRGSAPRPQRVTRTGSSFGKDRRVDRLQCEECTPDVLYAFTCISGGGQDTLAILVIKETGVLV